MSYKEKRARTRMLAQVKTIFTILLSGSYIGFRLRL